MEDAKLIKDLENELIKVISYYFGDETAHIYSRNFEGKNVKIILRMTQELLGEYLGKHKSEVLIQKIREKYKIDEK